MIENCGVTPSYRKQCEALVNQLDLALVFSVGLCQSSSAFPTTLRQFWKIRWDSLAIPCTLHQRSFEAVGQSRAPDCGQAARRLRRRHDRREAGFGCGRMFDL